MSNCTKGTLVGASFTALGKAGAIDAGGVESWARKGRPASTFLIFRK
jgi:hypothetical protein